MGRKPWTSSHKEEVNKGSWTAGEDKLLADHIKAHGQRKWSSIPKQTGLKRCGKSCRLRWLNYLRPNIKRGNITPEEEDLIIRLHKLLGNRWSLIAGRIPGRTDNEIKNYWNSHLWKKIQPENGKVVETKARQSEEATEVEDPSQLDSNICNMVSNIREADQPESSDASLTSSLSSAALTVEEDLSDMLMNFYTRDMSLSEFLDTDFTKFGNVFSNVAMVRGDQIQRTLPPYDRNEADDVEAPMSLIMSQEMVDSLGFTDFGFQLSAVVTDFADDEEHWNLTKIE